MTDSIYQKLKSKKTLEQFEDPVLHDIAICAKLVNIKEGGILFYHGDPSDALYIVLQGTLISVLINKNGEERKIGEINEGEAVGEFGAITDEPRSLTVKVSQDCELVKISADDFKKLCNKHPLLLSEITKLVISRARNVIKLVNPIEKCKYSIMLAPDSEISFRGILKEKLSSNAKNISILFEKDLSLLKNNDALHHLEKESNTILLFFEKISSLLENINLVKNDISSIYIVFHSYSKCIIDSQLLALLDDLKKKSLIKVELILVHPSNILYPENTKQWLALTEFDAFYHIRINEDAGYQRLMRFIAGTAIGLVFGGRGARAWGLLGVVKFLLERNVPIDYVAGTSSGAVIGACYLSKNNYHDIYKMFMRLSDAYLRSISIRRLSWPTVSILSGNPGTSGLQNEFEKLCIEDLWIPYFCVTSNLTLQKDAIHRTGLLWEMLRASVSVPGLFPPVLMNGHLHVDGALLNNLPVDIMRKELGNRSKIIAVTLSPGEATNTYNFPPILSFYDILLTKIGLKKKYKLPALFDTFFDSLLLGGLNKEIQNSANADILIRLDLKKYNLLSPTLEESRAMIELGYKEATLKLVDFDG